MDMYGLFLEDISWSYVGSVILLTYFLLSRVIINPYRWMKIVVSLVCGVVLGVIFYVFGQVSIPVLVYSFLLQVLIYNWVIKGVMEKLKISYKNGKGVI